LMSEVHNQEARIRPNDRRKSTSISRRDFHRQGAHGIVRASASSVLNECVTNVEPVQLTHRFTVHNFPSLVNLSPPNFCFRSTIFSSPRTSHVSWQICLYPGGRYLENANDVSLFLKMLAASCFDEVIVKAKYRFCFLNDDDEITFSSTGTAYFHAKAPTRNHSWGLRNISRQEIQRYVRADQSLVILCTLEYLSEADHNLYNPTQLSNITIFETTQTSRVHMENDSNVTVAELVMLTETESSTYSDVDVIVEFGDHRMVFAAHKYKLATHSNVFRNMLENAMDETQEASDVMKLAQKFNIPGLSTMCEKDLIPRVCSENLIDCLEMADFHEANYLFEHCIDFMKAYRCDMLNTEAWSALKSRNPRLCSAIVERVIRLDRNALLR
uniref:BTB domain-containing protein n=1 Tax=Angiostrongylus cantonensis TaxID=6313 RepID=A0A0K0D652_ANGCA